MILGEWLSEAILLPDGGVRSAEDASNFIEVAQWESERRLLPGETHQGDVEALLERASVRSTWSFADGSLCKTHDALPKPDYSAILAKIKKTQRAT